MSNSRKPGYESSAGQVAGYSSDRTALPAGYSSSVGGGGYQSDNYGSMSSAVPGVITQHGSQSLVSVSGGGMFGRQQVVAPLRLGYTSSYAPIDVDEDVNGGVLGCIARCFGR